MIFLSIWFCAWKTIFFGLSWLIASISFHHNSKQFVFMGGKSSIRLLANFINDFHQDKTPTIILNGLKIRLEAPEILLSLFLLFSPLKRSFLKSFPSRCVCLLILLGVKVCCLPSFPHKYLRRLKYFFLTVKHNRNMWKEEKLFSWFNLGLLLRFPHESGAKITWKHIAARKNEENKNYKKIKSERKIRKVEHEMLLKHLRYLTATKPPFRLHHGYVWQTLTPFHPSGDLSLTRVTFQAVEDEIENENFSYFFHSIWVPDVSSHVNAPERKMKF